MLRDFTTSLPAAPRCPPDAAASFAICKNDRATADVEWLAALGDRLKVNFV